MNNILVLDRNIVSLIKESNLGKRQTERTKIDMLCYLKKHDRKNSTISPLFSIEEGQLGQQETAEEMKATIRKEAIAVSKFFSKARCSNEYLVENANEVSEIFTNSRCIYQEKYDLFLSDVQSMLINLPKKTQLKCFKDQIISKAKEHGVSTQHPTVICCLSALYGYGPSRRIIKPSKQAYSSYNARNDLMAISHLGMLQAKLDKLEERAIVKFITLDKSLKKFVKQIKLVESIDLVDGQDNFIRVSKELFPNITKEEFRSLQLT